MVPRMTLVHYEKTKSSTLCGIKLIRLFLLVCILLWNVRLWRGHARWLRHQQESRAGKNASATFAVHGPSKASTFTVKNNNNTKSTALGNSRVFGACLMFKDDLSLLPEWLGFHYTVLPLRYLVLGIDVGNQQDPTPLLEMWKQNTDLQYDIVTLSSLLDYTTLRQSTNHSKAKDAHHALVNRQRVFMQACTAQLKTWKVHWTAFIDSDEFITFGRHNKSHHATTVASALAEWQSLEHWTWPSCYTMPRLRYGSLENKTCFTNTDHDSLLEMASTSMTTLRFVQHADLGDFQANKFGKALVNISAIPTEAVPYNIHRPYKDYCARPIVREAALRVNHYTGSLQRFLGRAQDARRTAAIYETLSRYAANHSCHDQNIQTWVTRFAQAVPSEDLALRLLYP